MTRYERRWWEAQVAHKRREQARRRLGIVTVLLFGYAAVLAGVVGHVVDRLVRR
jgi:hypothetical protein